MKRSSKWLLISGCFVMVGAVLLILWIIARPNALQRAAMQMVTAMKDGDAGTLLDAMSGQETACSNLDEPKLRRAWEIMVKPRVERSEFLRNEFPGQGANPTQSSAGIWFKDPAGEPWMLVLIANQAEDGIKTPVLFSMLVIGSGADDRGNTLMAETDESFLAGIRKYRPQLETLGIEKVMLTPRRCLSWDELEAKLLTSIEIREARRQQKGPESQPPTK